MRAFQRHRKEGICSDIFLLLLETSDGLNGAGSQEHSQTGSAPRSANTPFHLKPANTDLSKARGGAVGTVGFFWLNLRRWTIRGGSADIGRCSICSAGLRFDCGLGNQIKRRISRKSYLCLRSGKRSRCFSLPLRKACLQS